MFRSVLVPLDGSQFAEQALPLALSIAHRSGARLQVVHVVPPLPGTLTDEATALRTQRWRDYLDRIMAQLKSSSDVPISSQLLDGSPTASVIATYAEGAEVDLVVVTTHGRGPLGRFWVGSVAVELLSILPMPLMLLRPTEKTPHEEKEWSFKHMLLPLDGTELAERMIEPGLNLGTALGMDFTLLRAIHDLPLHGGGMDSVSLSAPSHELLVQLRQIEQRARKEAEHYLDQIAERLRGRGLQVQTRVVKGSDPASVILETAKDFDLISLESHGRRRLSRLVMGSVARKVIHGTSVPVMVHAATGVPKKHA